MQISTHNHLVYVLILCGASVGPATTPAKPDAAAGVAERRLGEWLTGFNSGNLQTIRSFISERFALPADGFPLDPVADYFGKTYRETGGLELQKISAASPASVTAICRGKASGYWMQVRLSIDAEPPDYAPKAPYKVSSVDLAFIEAPTELLERRRLSDDEIRDRTANLLAHVSREDLFSGAVLVARDEKVLFKSAYGLASRAWNVPNRTDTRFHLASVTKMFTAVAVAALVEQGKLAYTTKVGAVLPDYPNRRVRDEVTVHQLLSHTSGMKDRMEWMDTALRSPRIRTIPDFVKTFAEEPLEVEPGTAFSYSNAGYILLGAMIEKVAGQDYYTFVRETVFKRAGMAASDFFELDASTPNLAEGYADGPKGTRVNNVLLLGVKGMPAGGAYASVEDMLRFSTALRSEKLVKRSTRDLMWKGVTVPGHEDGDYGYGCTLGSYNGAKIVGHGGGWSGVTNVFEMLPEHGATIVILSNYDSNPTAIANKLHEWLTQGPANVIPVPPQFRAAVEVSPKAARAGQPVKLSVTVTNAGGLARGTLVDCEIKDARGAKVHQQFTEGLRFEPQTSRTFMYSWTPKQPGVYTVDLGVFGAGWNPKHRFDSGVARIDVR
jgi:CubicO group peptidase (beta-lactamase class C family)